MLIWVHRWNHDDRYVYDEVITSRQWTNLLGHDGDWELVYVGY